MELKFIFQEMCVVFFLFFLNKFENPGREA